jgi:D-hydroxyproline dehydrogenase subunit gamma
VTDDIEIVVDGNRMTVKDGMPLAAALLSAGITAFRVSVTGRPRAPICGMGSCFECRVTVDGRPHQRSCLLPCVAGMIVETGSERLS